MERKRVRRRKRGRKEKEGNKDRSSRSRGAGAIKPATAPSLISSAASPSIQFHYRCYSAPPNKPRPSSLQQPTLFSRTIVPLCSPAAPKKTRVDLQQSHSNLLWWNSVTRDQLSQSFSFLTLHHFGRLIHFLWKAINGKQKTINGTVIV